MTHTLYETLGVSKDSSPEQLKSAYKKLAVQHHPDKGGDIEKFKEISAAYDVLGDADKRRNYDQTGDEGGRGNPGFNPHDIFAQFFGGGGGHPFANMGMHFDMHQHFGNGGRQRGRQRGNDHHHNIHIPLRDAFFGIHKSVKVSVTKVCFSCLGQCHQCQGVGNITEIHRNGPFTQMSQRPCNTCNGKGQVGKGSPGCKTCGGQCNYNDDVKFELEIDAGVHNGKTITASGLGEQPQQEGDVPGDLILHIVVDEDANFKRVNNDLEYRTKLTFYESVIGKAIEIPHFAGVIKKQVADFGIIQPNHVYKIPEKGMPPSGDLHVIFDVQYPSQVLNESERSSLQEVFKTFTAFSL